MSFLEFVTANKCVLLPFVVIGGAFLVAIVGILSSAITTSIRTRAREQTRREIAAYIAEGSMSPEQGERLLAAKDSD
jgi:hypothetical protein